MGGSYPLVIVLVNVCRLGFDSEIIMRNHLKRLAGLAVGVATTGTMLSYLDEHKWIKPRLVPLVEASRNTDYSPSTQWDWNWDRREPESLIDPKKNQLKLDAMTPTEEKEYNEIIDKMKAKVSRNIILIRHSQYNLEGNKDEERYITELGREQAKHTGQRLKTLGLKYNLLVKSTMTRARQTAEIISTYLPEVPVKECQLLREGAPTPPEPADPTWSPYVWPHHFYVDNPRIEAAFRKHIHRAKPTEESDTYEIYVCHANVIRCIVCRSLQLPPEAWRRITINNASITWLIVRPDGRVILRQLGESGHIPPEKLTTT